MSEASWLNQNQLKPVLDQQTGSTSKRGKPLSANKDKLLAQATKERKKGKNSQLVVLPSHPTPYCAASPSRMGETFKTLQQWATKPATPQLPSLLHFLTRKGLNAKWQHNATRAGSQSSGKRSTSPADQPCPTTSRGSRHCAPHTPRPKACQRTSLPSCANRTHDTSASKGLPCSEVQHLPPDHRLFVRRVARTSLRHSSCWL